MIKISIGGKPLDLPNGFTMQIEELSPIFNDRGTQSLPATIPMTPGNTRALGAPWRLDAVRDPNNPVTSVTVTEGGVIRSGKANISSANRREGITMTIGFDNSTVYTDWRERKLCDLRNLPVWFPDGNGTPVERVADALYKIYRHTADARNDLAVFPVAVAHTEKAGQDQNGINYTSNYWEVLNLPLTNFRMPRTVTRLINDERTAVNVPEGYGVSPFIKVWRLLELVFTDLGYALQSNPFYDDPHLERLTVLNNCADTICTGRVSYKNLMPDATVEEFLNSLWVRFGLVWTIDGEKVTLRLMRDILGAKPQADLSGYMAGAETINYNAAQYLRISAGTSIEGASPLTERFEDFARGFDLGSIAMGSNVATWRAVGDRTAPKWDGDIYDSLYDEGDRYEPTDPDEGRYEWEPPGWWDNEKDDRYEDDPYDDRDMDGMDDDRYNDMDFAPYSLAPASRGSFTEASISPATRSAYLQTGGQQKILAWEFITGRWYKLDATNSRTVLESSSSFFAWDPQPAGIEPLELTSADECVPVGKVNTRDMPEVVFADYAPLYLAGSRHYHSYIADAEKEEGEAKTPLAYMFAFDIPGKTIGRVTGEGADGQPITLADGSHPEYSLYFQFKDGLFAKFWRKYDEILRHGNRSVEIDMLIDRPVLLPLDLGRPVKFRGVKCLLDRYTYSLPAGKKIPVEMTLRTIQTQGDYDIDREQGIPDFSISERVLGWVYDGSELDAEGVTFDTLPLKQSAVAKWLEEHPEYSPRPSDDGPGIETVAAPWSARYRAYADAGDLYEPPATLQPPVSDTQRVTVTKTCNAVFEIWEVYADNIDGDQPDIMMLRRLGEVRVGVEYETVFRAAWIF